MSQVHVQALPEVALADLTAYVEYRRSTYGTCKNRSLEGMARELDADPQRRVVVVVHRRSLARRLAAAWGLPVYLDSEDELRGSCVVCVDSAPRLAAGPVDLTSEQVVRHVMQGPMRRVRRTGGAWSALRDLAGRSLRLIFQDADPGRPDDQVHPQVARLEEARRSRRTHPDRYLSTRPPRRPPLQR